VTDRDELLTRIEAWRFNPKRNDPDTWLLLADLRAALAARPEPDDLVWKLAEWITPGGLMGDDPADWEAAAKRLLACIERRGPWLPGEAYGPAAAGSATTEDET
jgi:hypothetical protein